MTRSNFIYSAYSKVLYFHLQLESVLLMLWFYTKWLSPLPPGPKHSGCSHCFSLYYFLGLWNQHAWEGYHLWSPHLLNHRLSFSRFLNWCCCQNFEAHVSGSSKDQYHCHVLPKTSSSWSFWKFQIFLMHTFLQSYYILFPFDILQLCLEEFSPAFIIYLILKLLPFLV